MNEHFVEKAFWAILAIAVVAVWQVIPPKPLTIVSAQAQQNVVTSYSLR